MSPIFLDSPGTNGALKWPCYQEPLYRPPAEAWSMIVQVTRGCSSNSCGFCGMYKGQVFRAIPLSDIETWTVSIPEHIRAGVDRLFLADGDPLCLGPQGLVPILELMNRYFPALRRITAYGRPDNLALYSDQQIRQCRSLGLSIVYMGLESGSDNVLKLAGKGSVASDFVTACNRLAQAGIKVSATAVLGLGGQEFTEEHAEATALAVNQASPSFFSLLSLIRGGNQAFLKRIIPLTRVQLIDEAVAIISAIQARCVFRANHPSNLVPLEGRLPKDAQRLVRELKDSAEILKSRGLGDSIPVNEGEQGY